MDKKNKNVHFYFLVFQNEPNFFHLNHIQKQNDPTSLYFHLCFIAKAVSGIKRRIFEPRNEFKYSVQMTVEAFEGDFVFA